jgi:putative transcriptional regulator
MKTKTRKPIFERLKQSMEECLAHAKGELTLKTVEVISEPPEIDAATLAALRRAAGMSQGVFAGLLNVSPRTLQSWEQGHRQPADASRRLIQMFAERPEMFCQVVGVPAVTLPGVAVEATKSKRRIVVKRASKTNASR